MIVAGLSTASQKRHGRLASSLPCAPSATRRTMDFVTSVAELHGLLLNRTMASSRVLVVGGGCNSILDLVVAG